MEEFNRDILPARFGNDPGEESSGVDEIIERVRNDGDAALLKYTRKFDGVNLDVSDLEVRQREFDEAYAAVGDDFLDALRQIIGRVKEYSERAPVTSTSLYAVGGILVGQMVKPLDRVGVYVPGGLASYPSSVVMTVLPAKAAGVHEVVVCSPPGRGGVRNEVLVAAKECGVSRFFKVGGAQAIAAMAYGTETVPKAQKIVGPGNKYVTQAKKRVFGVVDIDSPAGPSEAAIIADDSVQAGWVAADIAAQAEHDSDAKVVMFTTSARLAEEVSTLLGSMRLVREEISKKALDQGAIVLVPSLEAAIQAANQYAPEHLELCVDNPFEYLESITNAGAIFLGGTSPVALGDYSAGPSHVLPTGGAARSFSALTPQDFLKISSVIHCPSRGNPAFEWARIVAECEGLQAHARSLGVRMNQDAR